MDLESQAGAQGGAQAATPDSSSSLQRAGGGASASPDVVPSACSTGTTYIRATSPLSTCRPFEPSWKQPPPEPPALADESWSPRVRARDKLRDRMRALRGFRLFDQSDLHLSELESLRDVHRRRRGTPRGYGGQLPGFLFRYDAAALCLDVLLMGGVLPLYFGFFGQWSGDMWWASLYYMRMIYALTAWPFLVYSLPVVGPLMHGALATGYDRAGALCPKLSTKLLRLKIEADKKLYQRAKSLKETEEVLLHAYGGDKAKAAEVIQNRVRRRAMRNELLGNTAYIATAGLFVRHDCRRVVGTALTHVDKLTDRTLNAKIKLETRLRDHLQLRGEKQRAQSRAAAADREASRRAKEGEGRPVEGGGRPVEGDGRRWTDRESSRRAKEQEPRLVVDEKLA